MSVSVVLVEMVQCVWMRLTDTLVSVQQGMKESHVNFVSYQMLDKLNKSDRLDVHSNIFFILDTLL